jgi:hypothetical protein
MKIVLYLTIPAIWAWAIQLSLEIRSYFNYELYQDYRSITIMFEMLFPILAILCTYIIVKTIRQMSEND